MPEVKRAGHSQTHEHDDREKNDVVGSVIAALSIALLQIGVAVSLAALVFVGDLSEGVPRAAITFVAGTGIVAIGLGLFSKIRIVIGGAQDTAAIVAAAIAAGIAAETTAEAGIATTMVAIALAGVICGALFIGIGVARAGEMARSIPFTVVSGFMAGTGWLLLRGGVEVMIGEPIELRGIGELVSSDVLRYWTPGIVLALTMVYGLVRNFPSWVFGLLMLATTIGIHVVARIRWSFESLERNDWLIGPFPESQGFMPLGPSDFAATDWGVLAGQTLPIAGLATVSLIGLILNLTGLEVAIEEDIELDHELKVAGAATIVCAAAGGMAGYHLLGDTVIADRLNARGKLVPLLIGVLCALTVFFGTSIVALLPRAVAGGVLAAAGINLLIQWARQATIEFQRLDAVLSALVLLAIMAFGVLTGIAAGVLAAVVVFVYSYARISPVRRTHRMDTMTSNIDRPPSHRAALLARNDEVVILELSGYLFFGSIRAISDIVTPLLEENLRYLVLDFRGVEGLDASVVSGLIAIERKAAAQDVVIVWSHLRPEIATRLADEVRVTRQVAPDVDFALEWVENQMLSELQQIERRLDNAEWLTAIEPYGERIELAQGQTLIGPDDDTRRLFAIVSGTLTAWGKSAGTDWIRYRQVGPGSFLGEVSFITGSPRTASVIADTESVVIGLSPSCLDEMRSADPALATETMTLLASRLADRLGTTSRTVRNLSG